MGIAYVVASAVAFGAMAILARIAYASGVDTPTLLALRFAIAAAAMVAIALIRRTPLPRGASLGALILLGALGYGGQAFSFFTALTLAPAGVVALLLYLHPALVALLAAFFLHERLTRVKAWALAIALAGTVLTIAPALGPSAADEAGARVAAGIGFAIAAAVFYSFYIVAGAWLGRRVARMADEHDRHRQRGGRVRHCGARARAGLAADRPPAGSRCSRSRSYRPSPRSRSTSPVSSASGRRARRRSRRSSRSSP